MEQRADTREHRPEGLALNIDLPFAQRPLTPNHEQAYNDIALKLREIGDSIQMTWQDKNNNLIPEKHKVCSGITQLRVAAGLLSFTAVLLLFMCQKQ